MITIVDVAREANASTATVSRVLNGSDAVTEEMKRRVMDAIEKVGYQIPSRLRGVQAASESDPVRDGEKPLILLICGTFIPPIVQSFQRIAGDAGYSVVTTFYDNAGELPHLTRLVETLGPNLAGIGLINCTENGREFQDLVGAFPLVQVGEGIMDRCPNRVVVNDEIKMGRDAADYLVSKGCSRIGILTGGADVSCPLFYKQNRLNGYYLSLLSHQIPVDQSLVQRVELSVSGGYEGGRELLERRPDTEAVIGVTDAVAQGALYAVRQAGKTDISVFSMSSPSPPGGVRAPYLKAHYEEMGDAAFHVLHTVIRGGLDRDYSVIIRHTLEGTE